MDSALLEILTADQMRQAEDQAARELPGGTFTLMENAGQAVFDFLLTRHAEAHGFDVLCGPGNNGGDGYVVARLLREAGLDVRLFALAAPREGTDAARAASGWSGSVEDLATWQPEEGRLIVDAIFGAGLSRNLEGLVLDVVREARTAASTVVAVDLPTGIEADTGAVLEDAFKASATISFCRAKPAHLMLPGRAHCGDVIIRDIGIDPRHIEGLKPKMKLNAPTLWANDFPWPGETDHKYSRGHVGVFGGGAMTTGAARLSAMAAARIGAGAVTVLSPANALLLYAMNLTSIMVARYEIEQELDDFLTRRHPQAFVLGPGFGAPGKARAIVRRLSEADEAVRPKAIVLDADGLTAFEERPEELFDIAAEYRGQGGQLVMTPHMGEYKRLFSEVEGGPVELARQAAARAQCVLLLKGADTVIADPEGNVVINSSAPAWLATAGSGDVLAGMIGGLLAQGMPALGAASAACQLHAQCAAVHGPGLMAEDIPGLLPSVLRDLWREGRDHLQTER